MRFTQYLIETDTNVDEGWKSMAGAASLGAAMVAGGLYGGGETPRERPTVTAPSQSTQAQVSLASPPSKPSAPELTHHELHPPNPSERFFHRYAYEAGVKGTELKALMAQARQETERFKKMIEITNGKKYDPKFSPDRAENLGNVKPGDGFRFRGRGPLQLTGRWNYRHVGKLIGQPLEDKPDLLSNPSIAAEAAIAYWKWRTRGKVKDFSDTTAVTKTINPGLHGLENRAAHYNDELTPDEAKTEREYERIYGRKRQVKTS